MINDRFKFRVWDKQNKCHIYDIERTYDSNNETGAWSFDEVLEDDNFIVEQCTGMKDKNERLIYEGDVVFCESGKAKGVIKFEKGSFIFEWKFAKPLAFLVLKYTDDVEIVGNIHEVEK